VMGVPGAMPSMSFRVLPFVGEADFFFALIGFGFSQNLDIVQEFFNYMDRVS